MCIYILVYPFPYRDSEDIVIKEEPLNNFVSEDEYIVITKEMDEDFVIMKEPLGDCRTEEEGSVISEEPSNSEEDNIDM